MNLILHAPVTLTYPQSFKTKLPFKFVFFLNFWHIRRYLLNRKEHMRKPGVR